MRRTIRQTLKALSLGLLPLLAGTGTALAYLTPSNPAVNSADPTQIQYMPASYLNDYIADPTSNAAKNYVIGPGKVADNLTTPNWAYSPPLRKFVDTLPGLGAANANNLGQYIPVAVPDIVTYPGSDYYVIELREFREQMHSDLPAAPNGTLKRGYMQSNLGTDTSGCTDPSLNDINPCTPANNSVTVQTEPHSLGPIIIAQKDRPVRVKFVNKLPTGAGGDLFIPVDTSIMGAGPFEVDYNPATNESQSTMTGDFTQNRGLLHLHGGRTPWISDGTPHQWITPAGEVTDYPTGVSMTNVPDMPDPGPGANTYYWTNQQSSRMMFYHDHAWGITRLNVYVGEAAGYIIRDDTEQALIDNHIIPSGADEIPLVIEGKTFVDPDTIVDTDPTWAWGSNPWDGTPGAVMSPFKGDLWWPHVYMSAENPDDPSGVAPMGRWAYGPFFWPPTNNLFQPVPNPYYIPTQACNDPDLPPGELCCTDNDNNPATLPPGCCDPNDPATPGSWGGFCQPTVIPSSPNPSTGAEAFMDTETINGTAYPVLNVDPKAYRFRILNADHDRFVSLSMYIADNDPTNHMVEPGNIPQVQANCADFAAPGYGGFSGICASNTEVRMVPASPDAISTAPPGGPNAGAALPRPTSWPVDGRDGGVPDWSWAGPDWIMIGSEGGFLPQPVVIPAQPIDWNVDVTTFNAGNVNAGALILGPAERADVIVDFSQYAGQTLILYNDSPAPWPAIDPHYTYYTGAPDQRAIGGHDSTQIGFGPNIRTIMQIKVAAGSGSSFDLDTLKDAFLPAAARTILPGTFLPTGVFRESQDDIVVAQGNLNPDADPTLYEAFSNSGDPVAFDAYNIIYGTTFSTSSTYRGVSKISDTNLRFRDPVTGSFSNILMEKKAIHDEQGATFDEFGRMRAGLGLTISDPAAGMFNFVVQTYSDPSTEILQQGGTQIWKITHNGVDTHPIHFHLFDIQVIDRVGWDGFVRYPDPTEMGWKDTLRISPLEDTIVAVRPVTPRLPFGIPESKRPLNPATPFNDPTHLSTIDPVTGQAWATPNLNRIMNFDWEYVWHCHILSHEENDMMRPIIFQFVETVPDAPALTNVSSGAVLTWTDATPPGDLTNLAGNTTLANPQNEIGFKIKRCNGTCDSGDSFATIGTALANATTFTDSIAAPNATYTYRVVAYNAAGDSSASNILSTTTGSLTPPTVSLTGPADGSSSAAGTPISITASASSAAGGGVSIAKVEFYVNGSLLGTDSTNPYSYNWATPYAGTYSLTAKAYDSVGVTTTSTARTITVVPSSTPTLGALTPSSVTSPYDTPQTYTAVYSDPDGYANLNSAYFLVGPTTSSAIAIYIRYTRGSNTLSLYNDAGSGVTSCTPGQSATLSNSQGSVNCAASSVTGVGNNLTLNLRITPKLAFASPTAKNIYMSVTDLAAMSVPLTIKGSWTISQPNNHAPTIGTLTPAAPVSSPGNAQTFTAVYSDPDGYVNLESAYFHVSPSGAFKNSILLHYAPASNTLTLYSDDLSTSTSCTPGQAATLSNSRGSINCAASSVSKAGTNLTLTLAITPDVSLASATARQITMRAVDSGGLSTPWIQTGSWTINNVPPALGSLTPSSLGSQAGSMQTFTAVYSDANGASDLDSADFLVTSSGILKNALLLHYAPASNALTLYSDNLGSNTSCNVGSVATLSNSQGSINCAASSAVQAGNNLTLTLAITPKAVFASPTARQILMRAIDNGGLKTRWIQKGSWAIGSLPPSVGSLTPTSVTSQAGIIQTFTAVYSDPNGASDLTSADFWVTPSGVLKNSIYLQYSPISRTLSLYSDDLSTSTSCTPGAAATLANSHGSINCASSSAVEAGTNLTMTLAITPKPAYVGTARQIKLRAIDSTGLHTLWISKGSWTIQ